MTDKADESKILFRDKRRIKSADEGLVDVDIDDANLDRIPTVVARLEESNRKNDAKLKEYIAAHKEKVSEMDQFRKKLESKVDDLVDDKVGNLLKDILVIVDDIDRSIIVGKESSNDNNQLLEGFILARKNIMKVLTKLGLEEFSCVGQEFDPSIAQAVAMTETAVESENNKILTELAAGYMFKGRVLRSALVNVGKYSKNE